MNAREAFAMTIEARLDYQCPAVQDAIDRLVAGEWFRSRSGMLEVLRSPNYSAVDFNASLLSAWKAADIELVTSHTVDWWLALAEKIGKMKITAEQHYRTEWTAIEAESYDGAEDSRAPVGSGKTKAEAVADLLEKMDSE